MFYLNFHNVIGVKVRKINVINETKCIEIELENNEGERVDFSIYTHEYEKVINELLCQLVQVK